MVYSKDVENKIINGERLSVEDVDDVLLDVQTGNIGARKAKDIIMLYANQTLRNEGVELTAERANAFLDTLNRDITPSAEIKELFGKIINMLTEEDIVKLRATGILNSRDFSMLFNYLQDSKRNRLNRRKGNDDVLSIEDQGHAEVLEEVENPDVLPIEEQGYPDVLPIEEQGYPDVLPRVEQGYDEIIDYREKIRQNIDLSLYDVENILQDFRNHTIDAMDAYINLMVYVDDFFARTGQMVTPEEFEDYFRSASNIPIHSSEVISRFSDMIPYLSPYDIVNLHISGVINNVDCFTLLREVEALDLARNRNNNTNQGGSIVTEDEIHTAFDMYTPVNEIDSEPETAEVITPNVVQEPIISEPVPNGPVQTNEELFDFNDVRTWSTPGLFLAGCTSVLSGNTNVNVNLADFLTVMMELSRIRPELSIELGQIYSNVRGNSINPVENERTRHM